MSDVTEDYLTEVTGIHPRTGTVSPEVMKIVKYVVDMWICSIISYVGIVDNIVVIVVLKKMGFQDTMNISLTAIAFWDLVKSLSTAILRMYGPIELFSPALAHTWYSFGITLIGYLSNNAGYVSGVLAAFVSIERSLSVSKPFTVKTLLTTKVVTWVNVIVSFVVFAPLQIQYVRIEFVWVFSLKYNATVAEFAFSHVDADHPWIEKFSSVLSVALPVISCIIIGICTAIIVYHLRKASKFRSRTTISNGNGNPNQLSSRDRQITKMLLIIIIVHIVTYIPRLCLFLGMTTVPDFLPGKRYQNIFWLVVYVVTIFGLFNASVNAFILFFMSSQFRLTLTSMLGLSKKTL